MRRAGLAAAAAIMAMATLTACGGGASAEEFCGLEDEYSNVNPTEDPDAFKDAMDDAVDKAPDDIKSDVETVRDAVEDFDPEDPEASAEAMGSSDFEEASKNLQDWTEENCSE